MKYPGYKVRKLSNGPAEAYILSILANDWHALGPMLAKEFSSSTGQIETLLPVGRELPTENGFRFGGVTNSEASTEWVTDLAEEFLHRSQDYLFLAQHTLASRGDIWLKEIKVPIRFFGLDVFFYCSSNASRENIELSLRRATGLPWSLAILSSGDQSHLSKSEDLSDADLRIFCRNAAVIIIGGVFDDEGYLVWTRE